MRPVKNNMWIQAAMKHITKGALTAQAKRVGMTPLAFAEDVLEHPTKHTLRTRRRAQFAVNVQKK